jgi:phage terminase Nu1 subunit (DNA packaging protein)
MVDNPVVGGVGLADDGANHPRGPLINTEQAARLLMKGPERVRQLVKAGWIAQGGGAANDRRFRLLDVVQGYIRFRDDEDRRANKTAAHTRITDARSREVELKNAQREGRLIELEEAIAVIEAVVAMFRLLLSGLPARVTRDLQFRRTIEIALNDILDSVADLAAKRSKALGARRASHPPVTPDGAGPMGGSQPDASANVGSAGSA